MSLPKILVLVPVWKRPEITEICFSGLDRLREHRPLDVLAIISEEDYTSRCNSHNFDYTFFENQPLGAKKNHGLNEAMKRDFDYLIEINSDDLLKNELIDIYDTLDGDYLALRNFCFLDSKTLELRQVESKTAYGIGRRYSRQMLERCKFKKVIVEKSCISSAGVLIEGQKKDVETEVANDLEKSGYVSIIGDRYSLWNDQASAGMDNESNRRLEKLGYKCRQVFTSEPLAVDIKSDVNIWKFNPNAGIRYDYKEFKKGLPELDGINVSHRTDI